MVAIRKALERTRSRYSRRTMGQRRLTPTLPAVAVAVGEASKRLLLVAPDLGDEDVVQARLDDLEAAHPEARRGLAQHVLRVAAVPSRSSAKRPESLSTVTPGRAWRNAPSPS